MIWLLGAIALAAAAALAWGWFEAGWVRFRVLEVPLEGLAPVVCDEVMASLTQAAAGGEMTVLLVEQRIRAALDFAEAVAIMERGRIAWSGTPAELEESGEVVERLLAIGGG